MVFTFVLEVSLWRMLERQRRIYFSMLVVALFVSGVFEMAGMMSSSASFAGCRSILRLAIGPALER